MFPFPARAALPIDWVMDGIDISPVAESRLRKLFPGISNSDQLQLLLKEIERNTPHLKLEAFWENDHWTIRGEPAQRLIDLVFRPTVRMFSAQLETATQSYLGQVVSKDVEKRIVEQVRSVYRDHGYPQAVITTSLRPRRDGMQLRIMIDEGNPCLFEEIAFAFSLPKGAELNTNAGDICDIEQLSNNLLSLEEDLHKRGYSNARLERQVTYIPESNSARILINGELGKIIRYEVRETSRIFILSDLDLIGDEELGKLDSSSLEPEAVKSELLRRYQNRGYADVAVSDPTVSNPSDSEIVYSYEVTTGPQYRLTNVQFEGATVFTNQELLEIMGLNGIWQSDQVLNLDELRKRLDTIKGLYDEKGYWNAVVRDPRVTKNRETQSAQIVVIINEGQRRLLHQVNFVGNKALTSLELRVLLPADLGEPLDRGSLIKFEQRAKEKYIALGYLNAEVSVELTADTVRNNLRTTVTMTIDEGQRVRIGEISIVGLIQTENYVVERELSIATGDWYDPDEIDKTRRALLGLGLFRSVEIVPRETSGYDKLPSILNLEIRLREGKPGSVSFGPGWSLFRGMRYSMDGSYNNLAGTGRQLFLRTRISEEAHQTQINNKMLTGRSLTLGYLEPYIFNIPVNGTATVRSSAEANEFWEFSRAGEIALTHRLRRFLVGSTISLFYGQEIKDFIATESQLSIGVASDRIRIGKTGIRYNLDRRDDLSWPTSGFVLNTETSMARYALGGELRYFFWEVENSYYFKIFNDLVFAAGGLLSTYSNVQIEGDSRPDILPPSERLHSAGNAVMRGFSERSLGPVVVPFNGDERVVSGGTHRTLFRTEFRYQITPAKFAITSFIDSGNVFFTPEEFKEFQSSEGYITDNTDYSYSELLTSPQILWYKNYVSYGLAANYLTPVGSINLAYGLPWKRCADPENKCEYERGKHNDKWFLNGQVHINVGATF